MQERIDDMWLLLHYNFTSRNWTGDLAIKGLISDTIRGELKDERKPRALFKNIKTLVNGSDLLQAMLSRNDDLALETPIKWRRIKCDDPERIQLHPFAHRALPYDHLFGRVLTNKHTPPSLHHMAAGDVAPTVGQEITIYNFPPTVFFTLRPTEVKEDQLTFSDLLMFSHEFYDYSIHKGPRTTWTATKRKVLYSLALVIRLDEPNNHIRIYDHLVQPERQRWPDRDPIEFKDTGKWGVQTPGCEMLLVYCEVAEQGVTEESIEASHEQCHQEWADEWMCPETEEAKGWRGNNPMESVEFEEPDEDEDDRSIIVNP